MKVMTPASGLLSPSPPSETCTVFVPSVSLRSKSARAGDAESNAIVARAAVKAIFRIIILRSEVGDEPSFMWMRNLAIDLPVYATKVRYRANAGKIMLPW
jgi:hypothetical protein